MKIKEKALEITQLENKIIINDRMEFQWKEILIFAIPLLAITPFLTGLIISFVISALGILAYILFRFSAWVFYQRIIIDLEQTKLTVERKLINKVISKKLITKKYKSENFHFKALTRSGMTKYLFSYKEFKSYDLMIIQNEADVKKIKEALM
ncbi:hypothetical protein [Flexithrix dorotheae]|uniref:hypothetical protein n=1 Tax=Flexithrix dorotheae TaxID=70993 RepID=UPI0003620E28|nr:hypothetical protein [Flexithrix dorotheae]